MLFQGVLQGEGEGQVKGGLSETEGETADRCNHWGVNERHYMKVKVGFLRNINPRRDDFFGYINRPSSDKPQKGFVCLGVSLILKFCDQNFHGLDWIHIEWIGSDMC